MNMQDKEWDELHIKSLPYKFNDAFGYETVHNLESFPVPKSLNLQEQGHINSEVWK